MLNQAKPSFSVLSMDLSVVQKLWHTVPCWPVLWGLASSYV